MGSSPTKEFIALLTDHAARLMQAAQDDWQSPADRFNRREAPVPYAETFVGHLETELRPFDRHGALLSALDGAVRECAELDQLAAFQPLFERAKESYGRAWRRARKAVEANELLDSGADEFAALTEIAGEIEVLLLTLDVNDKATAKGGPPLRPDARSDEELSDAMHLSSLEERRVAAPHTQFRNGAEKYGRDLGFMAIRLYDPVGEWPRYRIPGGYHIGLPDDAWKRLFSNLGSGVNPRLPALARVWLRIDGELWEGVFYDRGITATDTDLRARFDRLQSALEEFRRIARLATDHFEMPSEPSPGSYDEIYLGHDRTNRWLEAVSAVPHLWESIDPFEVRLRRLTSDVFTASARAIESLSRKSPPDAIPEPFASGSAPIPPAITAISDPALRQKAMEAWSATERLIGCMLPWSQWVIELSTTGDADPGLAIRLSEASNLSLEILFRLQVKSESFISRGFQEIQDWFPVVPSGRLARPEIVLADGSVMPAVSAWQDTYDLTEASDRLLMLNRFEGELRRLKHFLENAPSTAFVDPPAANVDGEQKVAHQESSVPNPERQTPATGYLDSMIDAPSLAIRRGKGNAVFNGMMPFRLACALLEAGETGLTRQALFEKLWKKDDARTPNALDQHKSKANSVLSSIQLAIDSDGDVWRLVATDTRL